MTHYVINIIITQHDRSFIIISYCHSSRRRREIEEKEFKNLRHDGSMTFLNYGMIKYYQHLRARRHIHNTIL